MLCHNNHHLHHLHLHHHLHHLHHHDDDQWDEVGGSVNCNVGPSREIDMFGGPGPGLGLGPAQGQGLGPVQKTAPTPGLAVSSIKPKNTKKKGSSSTPLPAVDWTARMLDMKRINTLIRSKEEVTSLRPSVAMYYPILPHSLSSYD